MTNKQNKLPADRLHHRLWRVIFVVMGIIIIVLLTFIVRNISSIVVAETQVTALQAEEQARIDMENALKERLKQQRAEFDERGHIAAYPIVIVNQQTVFVNGVEVAFDDVAHCLKQQKLNTESLIILKVHSKVTYHTLENLINQLRAMGYMNVSLASISTKKL